MGEVADATNNLTAIVLFWVWWVLLSFLDIATRGHEADAGNQTGQLVAGEQAAPPVQDARFAGIMRLDPGFDVNAFLDGARRAYEIIVEAYAMADAATLKPLLSPDVRAAFEEAFAARLRDGRFVEFTLIGIDRVDIVNVAVSAEAMEVTLSFHAQLVWAERDTEGAAVSGDPSEVVETVETWTFARPLPVTGPGWTVVATGM